MMVDRARAEHPDTLLSVVTLASRTGRYGGPFDTARRQVAVYRRVGVDARLLAGVLAGDQADGQYIAVPVRAPGRRYLLAFSCAALRIVPRAVRDAQVVHVSFAREALPVYAAVVALVRRRRLVLQPHGMLTSRRSLAHDLIDVVVKRILRRADVVLALTEVEADALILRFRISPERLRILGNPLPQGFPSATPVRGEEVVFVARLHPRKRVADFIELARRFGAEQSTQRFTIVGPDDGDGEIVRSSAREMTNLLYLGAVAENRVPEVLRRARVFVLTAESEPWGNVLVLALAMGIPCLVTRSTALAGVIERYGAGIVVDDRNADAMQQALRIALDDDDGLREMSAAALRLATECFGDNRQTTALRGLVSDMIGKAGDVWE